MCYNIHDKESDFGFCGFRLNCYKLVILKSLTRRGFYGIIYIEIKKILVFDEVQLVS